MAKMVPKSKCLRKHKLLVLLAAINFWYASCQNCSSHGGFQCGSIGYIAYPFWGGLRPLSCGLEEFHLICDQNQDPIINISSLSYRVEELDYKDNTMRVARDDMWDSPCPIVFANTTLDFDNFSFSPEADDRNVTLFFNCSSGEGEIPPNKFSCKEQKKNSFNFYKTGNESSDPGTGISCDDSIWVPVNKEKADELQNPTDYSINVLQSALRTGFVLKWPFFPEQGSAHFCNRLVYGSCISNNFRSRPCVYTNICRSFNGKGPILAPTDAPPLSNQHEKGPILAPMVAPPLSNQHEKGTPPLRTDGLSPNYGLAPSYGFNNNQHVKGHHQGLSKGIVIGLTVASILGTILITLPFIFYRFYKREHNPTRPNGESSCSNNLESFLVQHESLIPKRYKYSEIKKITKSFSDKLGEGGYGSVYKGILPDDCLVAVKVLKKEAKGNGEEFINEAASISRTCHVNIVNLVGFCHDRDKRALVYEYMPNKSLDKFLSSNIGSPTLDVEILYKIAIGVAKGLEYLHTGCTTRIVHFDIKPQNILLDEDFCPKISDFGLAKLCKKKQSILSMLGARGTIGYIAPEIFSRNFGGVSHKCDIYSYGMMILEMIGGRTSKHETGLVQSSENYFPDEIYEQAILADSETWAVGGCVVRKMLLVGLWCIQTSPSDRPSMWKVVEMLEGSIESIQIPPKPILFCANDMPIEQLSPSLTVSIDAQSSRQD